MRELSREQLEAEIDALTRTAEERRNNASDQSIRALRPAGVDWMSTEELERLDALQWGLAALTREERSPEAARKRIAAKRAARLAQQMKSEEKSA